MLRMVEEERKPGSLGPKVLLSQSWTFRLPAYGLEI